MGAEVHSGDWSNEDRQRYREKVRQDLDVFEQMLGTSRFDEDLPTTGMEIELNLVGDDLRPSFSNEKVLSVIGSPAFQTELARFNVELNVEPRLIHGDALYGLERDLRASLNEAHAKAELTGAHMMQIGILPTIMPEHFQPSWKCSGKIGRAHV